MAPYYEPATREFVRCKTECSNAFIFHQLPWFQPNGLARALDDGPVRRRIAAHKEGDTDEAIIPREADLGRTAILHNIK